MDAVAASSALSVAVLHCRAARIRAHGCRPWVAGTADALRVACLAGAATLRFAANVVDTRRAVRTLSLRVACPSEAPQPNAFVVGAAKRACHAVVRRSALRWTSSVHTQHISVALWALALWHSAHRLAEALNVTGLAGPSAVAFAANSVDLVTRCARCVARRRAER